MLSCRPRSSFFPYTTLFRSPFVEGWVAVVQHLVPVLVPRQQIGVFSEIVREIVQAETVENAFVRQIGLFDEFFRRRSEEHTSELQSRGHLVCRLLLEKKKEK